MSEFKMIITVLTEKAGSEDLSGKLRFEDCTNVVEGDWQLTFKYVSKSSGKMNEATFNTNFIVGYLIEYAEK